MATTTRSRVSEGIDGKDAVGLYLEGIAKTPLLTAEEEVELAKTIEIGLYAEHDPLRRCDACRARKACQAAEQGRAGVLG